MRTGEAAFLTMRIYLIHVSGVDDGDVTKCDAVFGMPGIRLGLAGHWNIAQH